MANLICVFEDTKILNIMSYTTQELETMLEALSNSILRLERDYNNSTLQERPKILWEIQQLSKLEKVLFKMIEFNEITKP